MSKTKTLETFTTAYKEYKKTVESPIDKETFGKKHSN